MLLLVSIVLIFLMSWDLPTFFTGICADIAVSKHEHWSSLAPLPFEVIISAGQKAKEESWDGAPLSLA